MISVMSRIKGSDAGGLRMRVSVALVFVVMGVETDKILFDQNVQVGLFPSSYRAVDTDLFAPGPLADERCGNANGYCSVNEGGGEFVGRRRLDPIAKIDLRRRAKRNSFFDGAAVGEALNL